MSDPFQQARYVYEHAIRDCISVLTEAFDERLSGWKPLSGYHQIDVVAHDKWLVLRELNALLERE